VAAAIPLMAVIPSHRERGLRLDEYQGNVEDFAVMRILEYRTVSFMIAMSGETGHTRPPVEQTDHALWRPKQR
jgi:hypothetical protein